MMSATFSDILILKAGENDMTHTPCTQMFFAFSQRPRNRIGLRNNSYLISNQAPIALPCCITYGIISDLDSSYLVTITINLLWTC